MSRTRFVIPSLLAVSFLAPALACTSNSAERTEPRLASDLDDIDRGKKDDRKKAQQKPAGDPLPPVPNQSVAVVNGVEISNEAFREIYDRKKQKYADREKEMPPQADERYRRSITERLILQEALRQEAEKLGVTYDEAELADRMMQQKERAPDWDAHLARREETEHSLRDIYIKELLEVAILQKRGELEITDADLKEEYDKFKERFDQPAERIRVSQILVRVGPDANDPARPKGPSPEQRAEWEAAAMAKGRELAAKARQPGADFAALAREFSDGPSARKGGDLSVISADQMPPEFTKVAFALAPGKISDPVVTKFGVHVIKVVEKYKPGLLPLSAVSDQLRERLELTRLREGRQSLRRELLEKGTIEDRMDTWLGPDPRKNDPPRRHPDAEQPDPHGHGADHNDAHGQAPATVKAQDETPAKVPGPPGAGKGPDRGKSGKPKGPSEMPKPQ